MVVITGSPGSGYFQSLNSGWPTLVFTQVHFSHAALVLCDGCDFFRIGRPDDDRPVTRSLSGVIRRVAEVRDAIGGELSFFGRGHIAHPQVVIANECRALPIRRQRFISAAASSAAATAPTAATTTALRDVRGASLPRGLRCALDDSGGRAGPTAPRGLRMRRTSYPRRDGSRKREIRAIKRSARGETKGLSQASPGQTRGRASPWRDRANEVALIRLVKVVATYRSVRRGASAECTPVRTREFVL